MAGSDLSRDRSVDPSAEVDRQLREALEPAPGAARRITVAALGQRKARRARLAVRPARWAAVAAALGALALGIELARLPMAERLREPGTFIANQGSVIVVRTLAGSGIISSPGDAGHSNLGSGSMVLITHGGSR